MIYEVNKEQYLLTCIRLKFKEKDRKEANQFGCSTVFNCIKNDAYGAEKFFIQKISNRTTCVASLSPNGYMTFFVTEDLDKTNAHIAIKEIRTKMKKVKEKKGELFVKVASWYREAQWLLEKIGFKKHIDKKYYYIYKV